MTGAGVVDLAAIGEVIAALRGERDSARSQLDRLLLAVDEAERTGATVIRLDEVRTALAARTTAAPTAVEDQP